VQKNTFFVDKDTHPQTIACIQTRAEPFDIKVEIGDAATYNFAGSDICGALVQYPSASGIVRDFQPIADKLHANV